MLMELLNNYRLAICSCIKFQLHTAELKDNTANSVLNTHKSFNQQKSPNPVIKLSIREELTKNTRLINLKFKPRDRLFNSHEENNIVSSDFIRIIY